MLMRCYHLVMIDNSSGVEHVFVIKAVYKNNDGVETAHRKF